MPDREKVIKDLHDIAGFIAGRVGIEQARNFLRTIDDVIELLKEDCHNCKLECLLQKYDELKEKYDALLKEQDEKEEHWIVLEFCANEGIYCSKCMNRIFDRSTKPKKKLSNYCPNCGSKNTHFFNPSTEKNHVFRLMERSVKWNEIQSREYREDYNSRYECNF